MKIIYKIIKNRILIVSLAIFIVYFLLYLLDIITPSYLGVNNINNLIFFASKKNIVPIAPELSHGWYNYMGTTYMGIRIFPALIASLKFDLTIVFGSLLLSLFIGFFIGISGGIFGGLYGKFFSILDYTFFNIPYVIFVLLLVYVIRPSISGFIIAIAISWFPFYIRRIIRVKKSDETIYAYIKKICLHLIPYIISDIGSIYGILTVITFFGLYKNDPFVVNLGNILNLDGKVLGLTTLGDWWVVIFPLLFMIIFIIVTNLMGYEMRRSISNGR